MKISKTFECFTCQGSGKYGDYDSCELCHGTGRRPMSERFETLENGAIWDNKDAEHAAHCLCGCQVNVEVA